MKLQAFIPDINPAALTILNGHATVQKWKCGTEVLLQTGERESGLFHSFVTLESENLLISVASPQKRRCAENCRKHLKIRAFVTVFGLVRGGGSANCGIAAPYPAGLQIDAIPVLAKDPLKERQTTHTHSGWTGLGA